MAASTACGVAGPSAVLIFPAINGAPRRPRALHAAPSLILHQPVRTLVGINLVDTRGVPERLMQGALLGNRPAIAQQRHTAAAAQAQPPLRRSRR